MAKPNKIKITVWIVLGIIIAIFGVRAFMAMKSGNINSVEARSKGSTTAKVQIVEFIDFECPACAYGSNLIKGYLERYPNDLRVQIKYFPLVKSHRHAMASALYSECAGAQGKFWEFHYLLMSSQKQWSPLISADAFFQGLASQAGLNKATLNACLSLEKSSATINDDRALGQSLGVQSTPSYFVNNKMIVGGKALEDELKGYFGDQ